MWRVLKENLRLRPRILDVEERLTVLEADYSRLDLAYRKLRGAVTGGIRTTPKEGEQLTQEELDKIILEGRFI